MPLRQKVVRLRGPLGENIRPLTSDTEPPRFAAPAAHSMLAVGCWLFNFARSAHCFLRTNASTTCGSASVVVSPIWSTWSSAIFRRMRRMILPERVFGRPGAN